MSFPRTRAHSGSLLLASRIAAMACLVSGLGLLVVDQTRSGAEQPPVANGSFRLSVTVGVNNGLGADITAADFTPSVVRMGDVDALTVPGDGTPTDLVAGTYSLRSTTRAKYEISDWACVDELGTVVPVTDGSFTATDGQRLSCRAEQRLLRLSTRIVALPAEADPGETVTLTFTIHNTGGAMFRAARVVSPQCAADPLGPVVDHGDDGRMETGEEWDFVCTHVVTETDPSPLFVQAWSGVHTAARRELEGEATLEVSPPNTDEHDHDHDHDIDEHDFDIDDHDHDHDIDIDEHDIDDHDEHRGGGPGLVRRHIAHHLPRTRAPALDRPACHPRIDRRPACRSRRRLDDHHIDALWRAHGVPRTAGECPRRAACRRPRGGRRHPRGASRAGRPVRRPASNARLCRCTGP